MDMLYKRDIVGRVYGENPEREFPLTRGITLTSSLHVNAARWLEAPGYVAVTSVCLYVST